MKVFSPDCFTCGATFSGAFEKGEENFSGVWNKWIEIVWYCGHSLEVSEYNFSIYLNNPDFYMEKEKLRSVKD